VADAAHPSLVLPHAPARFEFGYDVLGRRTAATVKNATGNVLHEDGWSFDILGRMSRQQSTTGTLDYAWDAGGNLSGVKSATPGGYDLSYDYDTLGRLATVHQGQEGIDPASRPIAAPTVTTPTAISPAWVMPTASNTPTPTMRSTA
jgi:YD repeat-containing protein